MDVHPSFHPSSFASSSEGGHGESVLFSRNRTIDVGRDRAISLFFQKLGHFLLTPLRRPVVVVRARIDGRVARSTRVSRRTLRRRFDWMFRVKVTHTDARVRFVVRVVACVPIATFAYKMSIDRAKDEERRMRRGT